MWCDKKKEKTNKLTKNKTTQQYRHIIKFIKFITKHLNKQFPIHRSITPHKHNMTLKTLSSVVQKSNNCYKHLQHHETQQGV